MRNLSEQDFGVNVPKARRRKANLDKFIAQIEHDEIRHIESKFQEVINLIERMIREWEKCVGDHIPFSRRQLRDSVKLMENEADSMFVSGAIQSFFATLGWDLSRPDSESDLGIQDEWGKMIRTKEFLGFSDLDKFMADLDTAETKDGQLIKHLTRREFFVAGIWVPMFSDLYRNWLDKLEEIRSRADAIDEKSTENLALNLYQFGWEELESIVARVFSEFGYECRVTEKGGDYGVDVVAKNDTATIAIQVKCYQAGTNIGASDIQKLLGAMKYKEWDADKALFITTSDYTVKAEAQAKGLPVELWTGRDFAEFILENDLLEAVWPEST